MAIEIEKYIVNSRASGMSDEQIRQELLRAGWQADAVNQALSGGA